jgi:hypothetical protein
VVEGLVPAIEPDDYQKKARPKRSITAKKLENYQAIWFKKLSTFSFVLNLKIDLVPKSLHAVVIRRFSFENWGYLNLFPII